MHKRLMFKRSKGQCSRDKELNAQKMKSSMLKRSRNQIPSIHWSRRSLSQEVKRSRGHDDVNKSKNQITRSQISKGQMS